MTFSNHSMIRLLLPFSIGISISAIPQISIGAAWISLVILLLSLLCGAFWFPFFYTRKTRWIPGLIITFYFLFVGVICGNLALRQDIPGHFSACAEEYPFAVIRISSEPRQSLGKVSAFVEVCALADQGRMLRCRGKSRITIYADTSITIKQGQYWLVPSRFRNISKRTLAGGFDYASWLKKRGIEYLLYLSDEEVRLIKDKQFNTLTSWGRKQQKALTSRIHRLLPDSLSSGLASAMLIGERSGLDESISENFRESGVVHVLCVSGLHTGTIYAGAFGLFTLLVPRRKRKPWMEMLPLILVAFYAIMTGMAPSVSRASLMLGLFTLSRMMKRHTNGLNILAGAAFLILLLRTEWLFSLGFQLSFLAVGSIMIFSGPILTTLSAKRGWKKYILGMAVVSIVAQAGTAGITLHSFHSFPMYFLPANLISIPIASMSIYTGVAMLLFDMAGLDFPYLSLAFSNLLEALIKVNDFFSNLPHAYLEHLRFPLVDQLFYYSAILLMAIIAQQGKEMLKKGFFISLLLLIVWNGYGIYIKTEHQKHQGIWVLSEEPPILIHRTGRSANAFTMQDAFSQGSENLLLQWARAEGIPHKSIMMFPEARKIHLGKLELIYTSKPQEAAFRESTSQRIILTNLEGLKNLDHWKTSSKPDLIIFDRSVRYLPRHLSDYLEKEKVATWLLYRDGHWKLDP